MPGRVQLVPVRGYGRCTDMHHVPIYTSITEPHKLISVLYLQESFCQFIL